jgi:hypothetical protein
LHTYVFLQNGISLSQGVQIVTRKIEDVVEAGAIPAMTSRELVVFGSDTHAQSNGHDDGIATKATGPKTELGKERSRRNAIKHGIFSQAILLKGEPRADFDSLRSELWESLRPVGRLEELLIDKLASLSWRYRRCLMAETGEIRKQLLDTNRKRNAQAEDVTDAVRDEDRLIRNIEVPAVLKRCLELLAEWRDELKKTGFEEKRDFDILKKIYGEDNYRSERVPKEYLVWADTALAPEDERVREGYATAQECISNVIEEIDGEMRHLKTLHKMRMNFATEDNEAEVLRQSIPELAWMERLLRYETSLERNFDRTLAQLERAQRLRQGQPVAPRLDVNICG